MKNLLQLDITLNEIEGNSLEFPNINLRETIVTILIAIYF